MIGVPVTEGKGHYRWAMISFSMVSMLELRLVLWNPDMMDKHTVEFPGGDSYVAGKYNSHEFRMVSWSDVPNDESWYLQTFGAKRA